MTDETTQALLPVKVTQADRDLIVTLMRPLAKSAIEHKAIDFIAEGRGDDAEAVQIVAKHRLAHSLPSQADAGEGFEAEHDGDTFTIRFPDGHALTARSNGSLIVTKVEAGFAPFSTNIATLSPPTSGEEMRLREDGQ